LDNLRSNILTAIQEIAEITGSGLNTEIKDDTVLLDSGLDSLGFAILVSRLEEELGYDPFVLMQEAVYPKTFGEFVDIYKRYAPNK
jgi:acyl carrier protein